MALTEQEELELLELEEMEKAGGTTPPRSAAAEIKAKHQANLAAQGLTMLEGKDTPMGRRQVVQMPSDLMGQAKAFLGAPGRMIGGMVDVAKDIGRMDEPLDTKLRRYAGSAITGMGEMAGKLGYGTPEEQAGVLGDVTTQMALGSAPEAISAGVKGVQGLRGVAPEGVVTPKIQSELMRGIKPINRKTEFKQTLTKTVPEVVESSEALRRPIKGIEDVEAAIPHAKMRVWSNYQQKLGPNAKMTIDGNLVADAMEGTITKRFETQNPAKAQAIRDVAATYRRDIPLQEAEDFLQGANNDLHSFYAKNKVGRDVAARDPEWGHVVKEAESLRDNLYKKLDEVAGPDAAELKRTYGELTSLNEEVLRRKNVSQRQNPTSLAEQISFAQAAGRALKATLNLNIGDAASALAQPLTARYLKNRGSSDALIERGFGRYKPKKAEPPTPSQPVSPPAPASAPSVQSSNALSPEFQLNPNLDPDVVAQWRAQAAQGPSRLTIGEAASQGVDVPLSQTLRYQTDPKTAMFDENFVRTAQSLQMTPEQLQQLLRQMP